MACFQEAHHESDVSSVLIGFTDCSKHCLMTVDSGLQHSLESKDVSTLWLTFVPLEKLDYIWPLFILW